MRILFCNYEYPPLGGGGGVVNAWLAEELAHRHQATVITSGTESRVQYETVNNVKVVRVPVYFRNRQQSANLPSMAAYVANAVRVGRHLMKQEVYDIINTHFAVPSGPAGHALSKIAGVPNVLSVHGGDLYDPSKLLSPHRHFLLRKIVGWLLHNANAVVAQSQDTANNIGRYYSEEISPEIIPLGIPRPEFIDGPMPNRGPSNSEFVMITVGRLVRRKANGKLIEILARLRDDTIKLIIVGDGPERAALEATARKMGVEEQVRFAGHVDEEEKYRLLSSADVYVSTSQHEGFGLMFLESMAVGLPIICFDRGGQTDFLVSGETGFIVRLNDETAFAEHIEMLRDNPELKKRQMAASLRKVNNYFIDRCAEKYEALFQQVLDTETS